ncbi:MAG: FkbM family methyltransferase [Verrucomicrobia bacterium]|nr:FkbM family methyltransferase [Verrucomicrobiota bacterium]
MCWDVGAHFGYHTLAFAALGASVAAFEPNPHNAARLLMNLDGNPSLTSRVRINPIALSDVDGESAFVQSADTGGSSSGSHLANAMTPGDAVHYTAFERATVRTARMDTLISGGTERPPDVIKIDVEGGEWLVLQGGRELLAKHHPVLLVEVHHIRLLFDIQPFLASLGYGVRLLNEAHAEPSRCFLAARVVTP